MKCIFGDTLYSRRNYIIPDDIVGSGIDSSLSDRLTDQVEVISLWQGNFIINYSATGSIGVSWTFHHNPGVDLLVDNDVGELEILLDDASLGETLDDGSNLVLHHIRNLAISNSIPNEDKYKWKLEMKSEQMRNQSRDLTGSQ